MADVKELNINNTTYDIKAKTVVDQNGGSLKYWTGTKSQYDTIVTKDSTTVYFLTDSGKIYFGDTLISSVGNNVLFDFKWSDHQLNNVSWLRADTFSWQSGDIYTSAYNHLVSDLQGTTAETETIGSYTITFYRATDGHKICLADQETTVANIYIESGVAWYYILDTTNQRFKLPRELPITDKSKGNGNGLGLYDGTNTFAMANDTSHILTGNGTTLPVNAGTVNNVYKTNTNGTIIGITTDPTKSGIISHRANENGKQYLYFYVGQFSQTATEQTAGLNTELFNGKADTDFSNVTDQAKILMSGMGMPSGTYVDLTLGATGTEYTAPANGWFYAYTVATANTSFVTWENQSNLMQMHIPSSVNGYGCGVFIPVRKGDKAKLFYGGKRFDYLRFIYAQGSESEA